MYIRVLSDLRKISVLVIGLLITTAAPLAAAQVSFSKDEPVFPAFEGWRENSDGTFSFLFGYFNDNWKQAPDVPVGENNFFSPGDLDRGQPTHFYPRRNRFVFEVVVPSDWGDKELVWSLNVNGHEHKAYATMNTAYVIDNILIASETGSLGLGTSSPESRANVPPVLDIIGDDIRTARVGESITLKSRVTDDGLPRVPQTVPIEEEELIQRMFTPEHKPAVGKINGLHLSWQVYRGPGDGVSFDPPQTKVWEDTRFGANSPWAVFWAPPVLPEDGEIEVTATFEKPGTYVLWGRADDGGLYDDGYITVNVSP
jgi:hypothetical protein